MNREMYLTRRLRDKVIDDPDYAKQLGITLLIRDRLSGEIVMSVGKEEGKYDLGRLR